MSLDVTTFHRARPHCRRDIRAGDGTGAIEISLTGTSSNRDGLGSIVRVTAGGSTYTKVMDGKSGYLSQCLAPLYFGLGKAERIDVREP